MKIDGREIKAIIFDYDGTLLDSVHLWRDIDIKFFAKRGMEVPETYLQDIAHTNLYGAARITREKYGIQGTDEELVNEWTTMSKEAYEHTLQLKEGAREALEFFKASGIKMVLATAGNKELFEPSLVRLDLNKYFDVKISVADVGKNKSHPDIFLEAARRVGAKPSETIVFEDMPTGLKSSFEAGFISYSVYDPASECFKEEKEAYSKGNVKTWTSFLKERGFFLK